jgi:di/tricarboxylate transporter
LWLWWLVSSIAGALAFEMPDRPELAIVVMTTVGLSVGTLTAVLWPMGLAVYGMGIARASARGGARARYFLVTEGE